MAHVTQGADRSYMYNRTTVVCVDTVRPLTAVYVMKREYRRDWYRYMTKEERRKYESLSDVDKLVVNMSSDAFRALGGVA